MHLYKQTPSFWMVCPKCGRRHHANLLTAREYLSMKAPAITECHRCGYEGLIQPDELRKLVDEQDDKETEW